MLKHDAGQLESAENQWVMGSSVDNTCGLLRSGRQRHPGVYILASVEVLGTVRCWQASPASSSNGAFQCAKRELVGSTSREHEAPLDELVRARRWSCGDGSIAPPTNKSLAARDGASFSPRGLRDG